MAKKQLTSIRIILNLLYYMYTNRKDLNEVLCTYKLLMSIDRQTKENTKRIGCVPFHKLDTKSLCPLPATWEQQREVNVCLRGSGWEENIVPAERGMSTDR